MSCVLVLIGQGQDDLLTTTHGQWCRTDDRDAKGRGVMHNIPRPVDLLIRLPLIALNGRGAILRLLGTMKRKRVRPVFCNSSTRKGVRAFLHSVSVIYDCQANRTTNTRVDRGQVSTRGTYTGQVCHCARRGARSRNGRRTNEHQVAIDQWAIVDGCLSR